VSDPSHVLFFSRGKGRGHAVPDAAIADGLARQEPGATITFASYGMGAATLRSLGWHPIDLRLPEDNPLWDTVVSAARVLDEVAPTLVVSHEECAVLPVAKARGLPTVFLTDWFLRDESVYMQALQFADEVIFLDDAGYQDVPRYLAGKVVYVGPVLQNGRTPRLSRDECRSQLGFASEETVIVVAPGGATTHSEALAPILDLVLTAYDRLEAPRKRLVWVVGGADHRDIGRRVAGRSDIIVLTPHDTIAWTIAAANLVITKGNRITTLECEALGVPSISISFGHNPPDDNRVARIRTNVALRARGLDAVVLKRHIADAIATREPFGVSEDVLAARCQAVIDRVRRQLRRPGPPAHVRPLEQVPAPPVPSRT
jgi:UDP-N-acetylglucosamine:LPS N-acetylglucosamine transferase